MVYKSNTEKIICLALVKLGSPPDLRYCFDSRINPVADLCFNNNYMIVFRRAQMINYRKMCFPVDSRKTKKIIEIKFIVTPPGESYQS